MKIFAVIFLLMPFDVFAYNDKNCMQFLGGRGGVNRLGISVSQFMTSTGECSFLGSTIAQEREIFYVHNFDFIKKDAAKGNGESLNTFIFVSGCKEDQVASLRKEIKNKFIDIFENKVEDSYNKMTHIIDRCCTFQMGSLYSTDDKKCVT